MLVLLFLLLKKNRRNNKNEHPPPPKRIPKENIFFLFSARIDFKVEKEKNTQLKKDFFLNRNYTEETK